MQLPSRIQERFRAYGRAGGRARAASMSPSARRTAARRAVLQRWISARFGGPSFAALGLPGGEIIDAGLSSLCAGEETVESLLVSLAAPRLKREGVPLPRELFPDADERLYRLLDDSGSGLAHAQYLAYCRQAASFADGCANARVT